MQIIKTTMYKRDLKKKILNKHLSKENEVILKVEDLLLKCSNMQELMNHPLRIIYNINKKTGDLKEIYTANINDKLRLYMKPVGSYPYNLVEIEKIEFEEIDDKHYGEG